MKSGLEIAQQAVLRPIADIAADAGIEPDELKPYGSTRAKVSLSILDRLADRPDGKLVITTAITPTKAGEGKTTTSVSLTQGLGAIGKRVMLALREPSMGPVFGIKGGGTGGGYAQVVPMEEINLHFNGDFHAITAAHNLLSAALDASIYHGNQLDIDPLSITWPRTLDVNDRRTAQYGGRPRRQGARRASTGGVRHHRRVRDHGDPRACERSARPPRSARADHRGRRPRRACRSRPTTSGSPVR